MAQTFRFWEFFFYLAAWLTHQQCHKGLTGVESWTITDLVTRTWPNGVSPVGSTKEEAV